MAKPGPKPGDYTFYWYEMGEIGHEKGGWLSATYLAKRVVEKHRLKPTLVGTLRKGFPEFVKSGGMERPKPLDPQLDRDLEQHFERRKAARQRGREELERLAPVLEELTIDPDMPLERVREEHQAAVRDVEKLAWIESPNRDITLGVLLQSYDISSQEEARQKLRELGQVHQELKRRARVLKRFLSARKDLAWGSLPDSGKDAESPGKDEG